MKIASGMIRLVVEYVTLEFSLKVKNNEYNRLIT